jgi:hypothetical protein
MLSVIPQRTVPGSGRDRQADMIRSVRIKNFRCFSDAAIEDCGLVNVIVGANAAGKTALLEAIYLASGGFPEMVFRLRNFRGLGAVMLSRTRAAYETLWEDVFFELDSKRKVEVQLIGDAETTRSFSIYYDPRDVATIPLAESGATPYSADSSAIMPITFEYTDHSGQTEQFKPKIEADGLNFGGLNRGAPVVFFSSGFTQALPPSDAADRFSELSKRGAEGPVRRAIKRLFPGLGPITVESYGGKTALYCLPPDVKRPRLPVGLISAGINKVLSLLLGISSVPRGVVLIDELENGLYHQTMPNVWAAIHDFCRKNKAQAFVTTHSRECVQSLLPTLREHESDFRLIRSERHGGERAIRAFTGHQFEAAVESDYELR